MQIYSLIYSMFGITFTIQIILPAYLALPAFQVAVNMAEMNDLKQYPCTQ